MRQSRIRFGGLRSRGCGSRGSGRSGLRTIFIRFRFRWGDDDFDEDISEEANELSEEQKTFKKSKKS